jgi:hypothetical protein
VCHPQGMAREISKIEDRLRYGEILSVEALDPAARRAEVRADLERREFKGFTTVADLEASHLREVPRTAGVYLVLEAERFEILYIGKAGGPGIKATLRERLTAYLRGGRTGKYAGHDGGKDIWTLPDRGKLLVCWKKQPDALTEETALIAKYKAEHGKLPFANHKG